MFCFNVASSLLAFWYFPFLLPNDVLDVLFSFMLPRHHTRSRLVQQHHDRVLLATARLVLLRRSEEMEVDERAVVSLKIVNVPPNSPRWTTTMRVWTMTMTMTIAVTAAPAGTATTPATHEKSTTTMDASNRYVFCFLSSRLYYYHRNPPFPSSPWTFSVIL